MALEFICARSMKGRIVIPRVANLYKIDVENKKISFYFSNPGKLGLREWKVPEAREIEFEMHEDKIGGYIIIPIFYGRKGEILKIGNR